VRVP
jgi:hypothetical protein